MTLVHKDQIAALEGLHRHAHPAAALFLNQFGDFDDLHGISAAREQAAVIQVKAPGWYAGRGQFGEVLFA